METDCRGGREEPRFEEADRRGDLEAGVLPGEQDSRRGERVQDEVAGGGEKRKPDQEHAGVGAPRGRLGEQEAEREGEGADQHDEPEVRRMVLPDEVVARLGEQDEQAHERDDAERAPAREPPHKRLSSAARYSVPPKSFRACGAKWRSSISSRARTYETG